VDVGASEPGGLAFGEAACAPREADDKLSPNAKSAAAAQELFDIYSPIRVRISRHPKIELASHAGGQSFYHLQPQALHLKHYVAYGVAAAYEGTLQVDCERVKGLV
jgi:hypothetical protein